MTQLVQPLLAFVIFFIGITSFVLGCSCENAGGLAFSSQHADLIILGQVIGYDSIGTYNSPESPYSMKVKILTKVRGKGSAEIIKVFGDYGADCRPYICTFKPGETWLLALNQLSDKNEFEIIICGTNYLKQVDSMFIGDITGSPWDEGGRKSETFNLNQIINILNHPEDYPLTLEQYLLPSRGLILKCNCPPLCPYPNQDSLNMVLAKVLSRSNTWLKEGDSYLIHVNLLIYKNLKYLTFNGIPQTKYGYEWKEIKKLEQKIKHELRRLNCWKEGSGLYNDIEYQVSIPIILRK